jgi:hypothetical protein
MTLRLSGDTSGFTEIKAADAAGDNSIKLPAANGSANQLLQNGGTAGELQYTSAGSGLHYDASGRLLLGTSTARTDFYGSLASDLQVQGTAFSALSTHTTAGNGAIILSRGTIINGSTVGNLSWQGDDGSTLVEAASITGRIEGAPGASVMPGKIVFSTNAGGAGTTPRMEIGSNGALKLLAGCPGIDFSGTQGAADTGSVNGEVLGNYEEGQFLPTVTGGGNPASTLTVHRTFYTRVGRLVTLQVYVVFNGGDTGTFQLGNLPFLLDSTTSGMAGSSGSNGVDAIGSVMIGNPSTNTSLDNLVPYGWTNYIRFYYTPSGSNQSWIALTGAELGGPNTPGGVNLLFTITYITADA